MREVFRKPGPLGENVCALIILAAVCLALLAVILLGAGAYESVSNPQNSPDTSQVCAFIPENAGQTPDGISGPATNVTGG